MRNTTLSLVVIVGGCADNVASSERESTEQSTKAIIRVSTIEPPTLIAFRVEGSATWQTPLQTGPSQFELAVDGPYRVTVVCDEPWNGQVTVRQVARTAADDRALEMPCDTVPSPYVVTGTMAQAGRVWLGASQSRARVNHGQFVLEADRGEHTLVALANDQMAVRRPVAVTGDTEIAREIDVAAEGHALEPVTLLLTNLDPAETIVRSIVYLDFAGTGAFLSQPLAATKVAPNAVLTARDEQRVAITAHGPAVGRVVQRVFRAGDPTTFRLPDEALGPVEFDGLSVTWSTLPAFDIFEVSFQSLSLELFTSQFLYLEMSRSFIATTGITSGGFETDIPGFLQDWLVDTSLEYHRFAGVLQTLPDGDVVGSDVSQVVEPASAMALGNDSQR